MSTEQPSHPTSVWPWVLMIAGDGVAVWRGYLAAWWYRGYLMDRAFDPSAAELYYLNAQTEAVYALAALAVAGIGVALLLRAQRRQRRLRHALTYPTLTFRGNCELSSRKVRLRASSATVGCTAPVASVTRDTIVCSPGVAPVQR